MVCATSSPGIVAPITPPLSPTLPLPGHPLPEREDASHRLLPSELAACFLFSARSHSNPLPALFPPSAVVGAEADTAPRLGMSDDTRLSKSAASSRNDLFSADWSTVTPHTLPPKKVRLPSQCPRITVSTSTLDENSQEPGETLQRDGRKGTGALKRDRVSLAPDSLPLTPPLNPTLRGRGGHDDLGRGSHAFLGPPNLGIPDGSASRPSIRLRLSTTREFILGEGRHATVYLGAIHTPSQPLTTPTPSTSTNVQPISISSSHASTSPKWKLCAAKRVLPDRESQSAGLAEAFILSKLANLSSSSPSSSTTPLPTPPLSSPVFPSADLGSDLSGGSAYILHLYGIKDERDGIDQVPASAPPSSTSGPLSPSNSNYSKLSRSVSSTESPQVGPSIANTSPASPASLGLQGSSTPSTPMHFGSLSPRHSPSLHALSPDTILLRRHLSLGSRRPVSLPSGFTSSPAATAQSSSTTTTTPPPLFLDTIPSEKSKASHKPRYSDSSAFPCLPSTPSRPATTATPPPSTSDSPRIILLLEYCPHGHLLNYLQSHPERIGKKRWLKWAKELVLAIAWVHEKGILHADIKPQNILIAEDLTLRLSDFGSSVFLSSPTASSPTSLVSLGTSSYSPPEFVRSPSSSSPNDSLSFSSDIFSLGVTLSVLISGREPFDALRRNVERMFWVSKGGFWDWEERRRIMEIGGSPVSVSAVGAAGLERRESARSSKSGRIGLGTPGGREAGGRGRAVSTSCVVGTDGELRAGTPNPARQATGNIGGQGSRSESVESTRSQRSLLGGGGDWSPGAGGGGSWRKAARAARLLLDEEELNNPDEDGRARSPLSPRFFISQYDDDDDTPDEEDAPEGERTDDESLGPARGGGGEGTPTRRTYAGGEPVQYFLNRLDVVPEEVRRLLKRMTSPRGEERPSAREVCGVLEAL